MQVEVVESCFVAPSMETPRKCLWVSSLDLERANRGHTPLVYFYPRRSSIDDGADDNFFDLSRLKESMAKALVAFYPLAGRVGVDGDGRIQIDCNSQGPLFVVARSQLALDDLDDLKPSPELRRLFVPRIEPSSIILAVQVTFMKCGGVVLGTAFHHVAVDAMGDFHFMQTWSAFSRDGDGAAVELPFHDRTLLRARSPPVVHPDALSVLYRPNMTTSSSSSSTAPAAPATTASVFVVSNDQLASLKRICGGASAFCAVAALVWQCASAARRLPPDAEACVSFSADIRRRGVMRPPLPRRYLGNGIITLCASGVARDISSEPLEHVAGRIQAARNRVDDELVRSAIDYYHELLLSEESGCYRLQGDTMAETELRVVSWLGMPLYDADFGWGKPRGVSRAGSVRGGYAHLTKSGPEGEEWHPCSRMLGGCKYEGIRAIVFCKAQGIALSCKALARAASFRLESSRIYNNASLGFSSNAFG